MIKKKVPIQNILSQHCGGHNSQYNLRKRNIKKGKKEFSHIFYNENSFIAPEISTDISLVANIL
jgi:alpha-tubulin suppressor-like RCC1 family protein